MVRVPSPLASHSSQQTPVRALQPAIPAPGAGGMIAMGGTITKTLAEGEVNSPPYYNLANPTENILPLQHCGMTSQHSISSRRSCCPSSPPRASRSEHMERPNTPIPLSASHSKTYTEPGESSHSSAPTDVSHVEFLQSAHAIHGATAVQPSDSTKPHSKGRRSSVGSFTTEDSHTRRCRASSRKTSEQRTSTPENPKERKCPELSVIYQADRQTHNDRQCRSRMPSPNALIQNQYDSGVSRQNTVKRSNSLPSKTKGTSFSSRNLSGLPRITELDEEIPSRNSSIHKSNLSSKSQADQGSLEPAKKGVPWKNASKTSAIYMTIKETISRKKMDRNPHSQERFTNVREENVTQVFRVKKTRSEDCDNHLQGSREGKSYLTDKRFVVKECPNRKEARRVNSQQMRSTRENVESMSKEQVRRSEDTVSTGRDKEGEIRKDSSGSGELPSFENRSPLTTIEEYESDQGTKKQDIATKLNDISAVDENQTGLEVNNRLPKRKPSDRANINENSSCQNIPEIKESRTSRDNLSLRESCLERSANNNFHSEPVTAQVCYLDNEDDKVNNRTMGEEETNIARILRERRSCSSSPKRKRSIFVNVQTKEDGRNNIRNNGERNSKHNVAEDDSLPLPPTPEKLLQSSSETSLLLPSSHRHEISHDDFTANLAAAKHMLHLETIQESCAMSTSARRLESNSSRNSTERRSDVHNLNQNQRVSSPQRNCKNISRKYNYSSGNRDNLCKKEIRGEREISGRKLSTDHSKETGTEQIPVTSNRSNSRNIGEIRSKSGSPLRRTETHRVALTSPSNSKERNGPQSVSTRRVVYNDFQERTRSPLGRETSIGRNLQSQSNVYQGSKRFSLTALPVAQRERISSPSGRAFSMENTSYKGNTVDSVRRSRLELRKEYSVESGRRVNSRNSSSGKFISNIHSQQYLRNSKSSAFQNEKRYTSPCSEEDISNIRLYETRPISSFSGEVSEKSRQKKFSSSKSKFDSQLDISKSRKTDTELRHNRTAAANAGFKSQHENYVDFPKRGKLSQSYSQEYGKEVSETRLPDLHLQSRYEENYLPELQSVYPGIRTSALKTNRSVGHGRSRSVEPSIDSLRVRCSSESDLEERYYDGSNRNKRRSVTPSRRNRAMGKRCRSGEEDEYSCKKSDSSRSITEQTEVSYDSHKFKRTSSHHNEVPLNTTDEWKEYPEKMVTVDHRSVSKQRPGCEPQSRDREGFTSAETDSDGLRQEVIKRRRHWIAGSLASSYRGEPCSSEITCSSVSYREDKLRSPSRTRRGSCSSLNCHEGMIERTCPADKLQTADKGVFSRKIYQQGRTGYYDIHDGRKSDNTQSLSSFSHNTVSETGNRSKSESSQGSSNNSVVGYRSTRNTLSSTRKIPSIPSKDSQYGGRNSLATSPVKVKKTQLRVNDPGSLPDGNPFISSKGTRRSGEIIYPRGEEDEEEDPGQFSAKSRADQMGPAFGIDPKMILDQKKKIKRRAQSSTGPTPNYFQGYTRSTKHITGALSDSELKDVLDRPRSLSDSVRSGEVPSYKKALAIFERKTAEARKEYEQSIYKFREMRLKQKYREWDDPPLPALPRGQKLP